MPFNYYIPGIRPSSNLEQHLMGLNRSDANNGYTEKNVFLIMLIIIGIVNVVAFANYYYGLLDRPRRNKRWIWGLHVLLLALAIFGIALSFPTQDLRTSNFNPQYPFTSGDCYSFAFESAVVSILFSAGCTLLLKWKSRSNKFIPF